MDGSSGVDQPVDPARTGAGSTAGTSVKPDLRPDSSSGHRWYRRPLPASIAIAILMIVVVIGVLWWRHARTYEFTDDAYVNVPIEQVSPQISARVMRVRVNDNQDIHAGDVLVELDPVDYESRFDQALATEEQARSQLVHAQAQVVVEESGLAQEQANILIAEANQTKAAGDLRRYEMLRKTNPGAASAEQLDQAVAASRGNEAQLKVAHRAVSVAEARVGLAKAEVAVAGAGLRNASEQLRQARLILSYTQIRSRLDGRVARKTVSEGNYVQPGTDLMAIVPRNVHVTANFKETQLARMRIGQRAEVVVDAYPKLVLQGHVDSLQAGTGQAFNMLPAENATGNWVKVVQRLPVKIVLDRLPQDPERLSPGMSAEVTVLLTPRSD